ncbi:MAG TPA: DegT/DnrJ/EryC1/StrS family aminotransferase [Gemmatimonadales bacterium]|nr:DegT/DnrJ/EryC1/StrS family aminotransferase [Gemmatimonadales bacterium]
MSAPPRGRWQPPAHSPIGAPALLGAVAALSRSDPRPALADLLRREYGADHLLLTDSGTDALQVAIRAAVECVSHPVTVAIPAYSCFDVATAAVGAGAAISCYDIDPRSLGPDLTSLERCLAEGARVIVVAPLFGVPVEWERIAFLAERYRAVLIEDAAQGLGAMWKGRRLGSFGALSVLSFGRGKGWTGGSGGAVLWRAPAPWSEKLTLLGRRSMGEELIGLGAAFTQWAFGRPGWFGVPASVPALHVGETRYHAPRVARPMRRAAATLLLRTRNAALLECERRRATGEWMTRALPFAHDIQRIEPPAGGIAGWLRFPLLFTGGWEGFDDQRAARRAGLAAGYPRILPALPAVAAQMSERSRQAQWPGAELLVRRLVTLPTHSLLTPGDHARLVGLVDRYARRSWKVAPAYSAV